MSIIDYNNSVIEEFKKSDSLIKTYKFYITNDLTCIDTSKIEVGDVIGILNEDNIVKEYFVYSGDDNFILMATSEDLKDIFEKDELDKYLEKCNEEQ